MCKCPVGIGHPVRLFAPLHGPALAVCRVCKLAGQPLRHRILAPFLGISNKPPYGKGQAFVPPDFLGHLVGLSSNPSGPHLDGRLHILHSLLKNLQSLIPGPLLNQVQGTVKGLLPHALFSLLEETVNKPGNQNTVEFGIWK